MSSYFMGCLRLKRLCSGKGRRINNRVQIQTRNTHRNLHGETQKEWRLLKNVNRTRGFESRPQCLEWGTGSRHSNKKPTLSSLFPLPLRLGRCFSEWEVCKSHGEEDCKASMWRTTMRGHSTGRRGSEAEHLRLVPVGT